MLVKGLRDAGADVWYDEHNLGAAHLFDEIQKQITARPTFLVVMSKAALASEWVRQECQWAFQLRTRESHRIIVPVTAQPISPSDFNGQWLFMESFRRVEAPGGLPLPATQAVGIAAKWLGLKDPVLVQRRFGPQPSS